MRNTNKPKRADEKQIEHISIAAQHRSFSGPLPPPEDLAKYDQIVPGAAERIIGMAEAEMKHRHKNEDTVTRGIIHTTYLSAIFAFVVAISLAALAFYLAYKGSYTAAASVAVGSIAAVISAFVVKSHSNKKDKQQF